METELWFTAEGKVESREVLCSEPKDHEVLIKAQYSLISSGTELLLFNRTMPLSIMSDMKIPYMKGDFESEFTYGYSFVGTLADQNHAFYQKSIHVLHPHQSYALINEDDLDKDTPQNISPKLLTLSSNLETALNAVWDAHINTGDSVLIVGFGLIGALIAGVLSQDKSLEISVIEQDTNRSKLAEKLGFKLYQKGDKAFDRAFNTTAHENGLQTGLDALGYEGKLVEVSWYGNREVTIALGHDFHTKRKQIISSQVSNLPSHQKPRWDYKRRKKMVYKLLADPYFSLLPLREVSFDEDMQNIYETLHTETQYLGTIIIY